MNSIMLIQSNHFLLQLLTVCQYMQSPYTIIVHKRTSKEFLLSRSQAFYPCNLVFSIIKENTFFGSIKQILFMWWNLQEQQRKENAFIAYMESNFQNIHKPCQPSIIYITKKSYQKRIILSRQETWYTIVHFGNIWRC